MAEIVYDMAPGANLYLIKVEDTLDLWAAKEYSKSNGIKIINHSLVVANSNFYDGECWFPNAACSADDTINVYLTWDAWPTTNQDYNLYLLNSSLNQVAVSDTLQTGTQEPTEEISYFVPSNGQYYLAIYKYSAPSNHRLEVYSLYHNLSPAMASSSLLSPADADGAAAVFRVQV